MLIAGVDCRHYSVSIDREDKTVATEIEIKLAFTEPSNEPALDALQEVLGQSGFDPAFTPSFKESRLENAYFDTPDFQLHAAKVALRIRRKVSARNEVQYIQTLKTAGSSQNGLSRRGEWEWALAGPQLDLQNLEACEGWPENIAVDRLQKIFETNFTRFACDVRWGESVIELVLDWGNIVSNNKTEALHEIELELKQGSATDLRGFSDQLLQMLPVKPFDISKAERGFSLFKH
jgi:inorganic triphosphatase YgiF